MSRGKKILALLNKDLRERFNTSQNKANKRKNEDSDIDYVPETSGSDSSDNESGGCREIKTTVVNNSDDHPPCHLPLDMSVSNKENIDPCDIVSQIIEDLISCVISEVDNIFTKKGTIRKRKRFDKPLSVRLQEKKQKKIMKHAIKPPCSDKCLLKCTSKFNSDRREFINQQYWESSKDVQQNFLLHHVVRVAVKRRTVVVTAESPRKSITFNYTLKDEAGEVQRVCKTFFLGALGYDPHDDRFLRHIVSEQNKQTAIQKVGKKLTIPPNKKIDRNVIVEHINSFRPTVSHYRREHAPNKRYLPTDINITYMHKHFQQTHPSVEISYWTYRQVVAEENISFVKLGHEECWSCEIFNLHIKQVSHDKENLPEDCDVCQTWSTHTQKAKSSREAYQKDGELDNKSSDLIVSADLQKVSQ